MTDKELLHQLLRRNHQLTAKCEGLAKRVQMLEETRPPVEVLNKTIEVWDHTIDDHWHKLQILSVIVDWVVDKLDGDFDSFYDQAEKVVNKERLEAQFEESSTDEEDGHS